MPSLQEWFGNAELQPIFIGLMFAVAIFNLMMVLARAASNKEDIGRRAAQTLNGTAGTLDATWQHKANRVMARAANVFAKSDRAGESMLKRELMQAGYFSEHSVAFFNLIRLLSAIALPALFLVGLTMLPFRIPTVFMALGALAFALLGMVLPPVLLDRRIVVMQQRYRNALPDMMDVLVVCVESGQSVQSAFAQVSREIMQVCQPLGFNLHLLSLELRAGSTIDAALRSLYKRVGLEEVKSLAVLLKQSEELGASISGTLRVFSDEMRDKRLIRAETKANLLPVKMTIPLGLFIFPVILLVILVPVMIRIKNAFV